MSEWQPRFGLPVDELKARLRRAESAFAGAPDFEAAMPVLASVLRDIAQTRLEAPDERIRELERSARQLVRELERTRGARVAHWLGDAARADPELERLMERMEEARSAMASPSPWTRADDEHNPWLRLDPRPELERLLHASPWLFDPDWTVALDQLEEGERESQAWLRRLERRRSVARGLVLLVGGGLSVAALWLPISMASRIGLVGLVAFFTLLCRPHAPLHEDRRLLALLAAALGLGLGGFWMGSLELGGDEIAFDEGCRIRAEASVDSEVTGSLGPGETVTVLETKGRWKRVEAAAGSGWVGCR